MRWNLAILVAVWVGPVLAADVKKIDYPPMPEAFSSFGAAVCDGFVYVYGGHVGKTHTYSTAAVTSKFRRLSLSEPGKGWQELAEGPAIQGLALVAHGGKVYRIGGMQPRNKVGEPTDNHSLASCAVFDPAVGKWRPMPDLPAPRSSHDAVVVGDKIIVAGGWHMSGRGKANLWHDSALVFDLGGKDGQWRQIAQPFKRRALNLAALGRKVYAVCGLLPAGGTSSDVDVLDLDTNTWSKGPSLPGSKRNGFTPAACTLEGTVYVSPADGEVYRLNARRDTWEPVASLERRRLVHRVVPAGPNLLLVLGGASAGGNLASLEAITPKQ